MKIANVFFTLFVCIFSSYSNEAGAQSRRDFFHQKPVVFRVNLLKPSVGAEVGLTKTNTLSLQTGFTPFLLAPVLGIDKFHATAEYRHYYNLQKRQAKEKNTADFAANYVSAFTNVGWHDSNAYKWQYGVNIGVQRNLGKYVYWGIAGGPTSTVSLENGKFSTKYRLFSINTAALGFRF